MSSQSAACSPRVLVGVLALVIVAAAWGTAAGLQALWSIQWVESSGVRDHNGTSIALDAGGDPHIAFYEGTQRDLAFTTRAGGFWTTSVVDTIGDTGRWPSLQIDAAGDPHVAYYWKANPDGTPSENLMYARRSGGIWSLVVVDSSTAVGQYCSLALDTAGNPHIAYFDAASQALRYATSVAGAWTLEVVDNSANVGLHTSMVLDDADQPHVAYQNRSDFGLRYASKSNGLWTIENVVSQNTTPALAVSAVQTSLDLDSNGNAHIVFRNELSGKSMYSRNTSGTWTTGIATAQGQEFHGSFHSIRIAPNDVPTMSYFDVVLGELRLATFGGIWWVAELVTPNGLWTSLAIDDLGHSHVSFHAPAQSVVKYAVKSDITSDTGVPAPGARIALGATPNPMRVSTTLFLRTPVALPWELAIVDARGRRVRALAARAGPGPHALAWDGRDDRGHRVGVGIYFAVVRQGRERVSEKIVVVR